METPDSPIILNSDEEIVESPNEGTKVTRITEPAKKKGEVLAFCAMSKKSARDSVEHSYNPNEEDADKKAIGEFAELVCKEDRVAVFVQLMLNLVHHMNECNELCAAYAIDLFILANFGHPFKVSKIPEGVLEGFEKDLPMSVFWFAFERLTEKKLTNRDLKEISNRKFRPKKEERKGHEAETEERFRKIIVTIILCISGKVGKNLGAVRLDESGRKSAIKVICKDYKIEEEGLTLFKVMSIYAKHNMGISLESVNVPLVRKKITGPNDASPPPKRAKISQEEMSPKERDGDDVEVEDEDEAKRNDKEFVSHSDSEDDGDDPQNEESDSGDEGFVFGGEEKELEGNKKGVGVEKTADDIMTLFHPYEGEDFHYAAATPKRFAVATEEGDLVRDVSQELHLNMKSLEGALHILAKDTKLNFSFDLPTSYIEDKKGEADFCQYVHIHKALFSDEPPRTLASLLKDIEEYVVAKKRHASDAICKKAKKFSPSRELKEKIDNSANTYKEEYAAASFIGIVISMIMGFQQRDFRGVFIKEGNLIFLCNETDLAIRHTIARCVKSASKGGSGDFGLCDLLGERVYGPKDERDSYLIAQELAIRNALSSGRIQKRIYNDLKRIIEALGINFEGETKSDKNLPFWKYTDQSEGYIERVAFILHGAMEIIFESGIPKSIEGEEFFSNPASGEKKKEEPTKDGKEEDLPLDQGGSVLLLSDMEDESDVPPSEPENDLPLDQGGSVLLLSDMEDESDVPPSEPEDEAKERVSINPEDEMM